MLTSQSFAGDPLLEAIAAGGPERISRFQNSTHPAVLKVQQALLLWDAAALPLHGADGIYGQESASAVVRFKVVELQVPAGQLFDDVGPQTVNRLDEIAGPPSRRSPSPSPSRRRSSAGTSTTCSPRAPRPIRSSPRMRSPSGS